MSSPGAPALALSDRVAVGMAVEEPAFLGLVNSATASLDDRIRSTLRAGDHRGALTLLMDSHGTAVHRYCARLLRDPDRAEDTLQAVFIDAFQTLPRFEDRSSFRTWLLGIARHRCLDQLRRQRRWNRIADQIELETSVETSSGGQAEVPMATREVEPELEACLGKLGAGARDTLLLRFREDLSYEEMANVTGCKAGALRVRILRALEALRTCLEKRGVSFK